MKYVGKVIKISTNISTVTFEGMVSKTNLLHNRTLHISYTFKEPEKPDIKPTKPDIDTLKPDIENTFQPKTASHILKLREAFPGQTIFGRSDVMKVIDIKASRASDLLKEMAEHGIIEPVSGHGKGKYRFRHRIETDKRIKAV